MKGCRPLRAKEADAIMESFSGQFALRNRAIFALGRYTGERISAILALRVGDVVGPAGRLEDRILYRRANRKGKTESRIVPLHPKAKKALEAWLTELGKGTVLTLDDYVFPSRKGRRRRPLSRVQYYRILKEAAAARQLSGKIATHSLRKTFADHVYEALGRDIFRLQKALGHKNINSTVQYLSFKESDIEKAIRGMS